MFDSHIHSKFSFDTEADPFAMVRQACNLGLKEICFSEHKEHDPRPGVQQPVFDFAAYQAIWEPLRQAFPQISIGFGVEIGVVQEFLEECKKTPAACPFDMVIGSLHFVEKLDPYDDSDFLSQHQQIAYEKYLKELLHMLSIFDDFDIVGHIGYPARYYHGEGYAPFRYRDFPDLFDAILKTIIQRGHGIEINTSGLDNGGAPCPPYDIVARYLELGGEILTIGSDAHGPEKVGNHVFDVIPQLKEMGVSYLCTFHQRKPVFHKIP